MVAPPRLWPPVPEGASSGDYPYHAHEQAENQAWQSLVLLLVLLDLVATEGAAGPDDEQQYFPKASFLAPPCPVRRRRSGSRWPTFCNRDPFVLRTTLDCPKSDEKGRKGPTCNSRPGLP